MRYVLAVRTQSANPCVANRRSPLLFAAWPTQQRSTPTAKHRQGGCATRVGRTGSLAWSAWTPLLSVDRRLHARLGAGLQRRVSPRGRPCCAVPRIASRVGTHKPGTQRALDSRPSLNAGASPCRLDAATCFALLAPQLGCGVLWVPTREAWGRGRCPHCATAGLGAGYRSATLQCSCRRSASGSPGLSAIPLGRDAPQGASMRRPLRGLHLAPLSHISGSVVPWLTSVSLNSYFV